MSKKKKKTKTRKVYVKRKRRRKDRRMPLSVGVGLGVSAFSPPAPAWTPAFEQIKRGNMAGALSSFVRSWTGIYGLDGAEPFGVNLIHALNPFDFSDAPAWKATLWTALISKVIKRFAKTDPFEKIPFVNKFVKFG